MDLLRYMAPVAVLLLVPATLAMERDAFGVVAGLAREDPSFLWLLLCNSCLAYFVNLTNFLVTKHTSPLTLQVRRRPPHAGRRPVTYAPMPFDIPHPPRPSHAGPRERQRRRRRRRLHPHLQEPRHGRGHAGLRGHGRWRRLVRRGQEEEQVKRRTGSCTCTFAVRPWNATPAVIAREKTSKQSDSWGGLFVASFQKEVNHTIQELVS
jgi:hypothetical protein